MKKNLFYIIIISLLAITACSSSNKRTLSILKEAELIIDSVPAMALIKLQEIKNPSKLSQSQLAMYNLLFTKGIVKAGQKLSSDSSLIQPIAFFKEKDDSLRLSEAYYYKGLYHYYKASHDTAVRYFIRATNAVPSNEHDALKAKYMRMSGYSYQYLNDTTNAISYREKALAYAENANAEKEIQPAILSLAEAYRYNKEIDQSIKTYYDAIIFAKQNKDIALELYILNTISSIYESENNIEEALKYKKMAKELNKSRTDIPTMNLNLARIYLKQNRLDSASHHAQIAIGGNDTYVAMLAYRMMSEINKKRGLYVEELNNIKNEDRLLNTINGTIDSRNMEQKYLEEKLKNENNQLKIEQQRHKLWFLIVLFLLFVLIVVFIFIWRENRRRDEKARLKNKEELLKKENLLLKQKQEISILREKELMLRESLFKRINLFNKVPSLNKEDTNNQKNNKIQLKESDWEELIKGINDAYPNFINQLNEKASTLTEDDIRFCCLVKINVDMQDLSDIYCVSKAAITKRKYRLKTDKFNITDSDVNLNTLILDL